MTDTTTAKPKARRGFAAMDPALQRELATRGGHKTAALRAAGEIAPAVVPSRRGPGASPPKREATPPAGETSRPIPGATRIPPPAVSFRTVVGRPWVGNLWGLFGLPVDYFRIDIGETGSVGLRRATPLEIARLE